MARQLFLNVPTADLAAADTFYGGLGFTKNDDFSDVNASSWIVDDGITVMVLRSDFFATFLNDGDTPHLPGAGGPHETLTCLSCESPEEVDTLLAVAADHGGSVYRPAEAAMPGMYGGAFADPDGHVWELMWMDMDAVMGQDPGDRQG